MKENALASQVATKGQVIELSPLPPACMFIDCQALPSSILAYLAHCKCI